MSRLRSRGLSLAVNQISIPSDPPLPCRPTARVGEDPFIQQNRQQHRGPWWERGRVGGRR